MLIQPGLIGMIKVTNLFVMLLGEAQQALGRYIQICKI